MKTKIEDLIEKIENEGIFFKDCWDDKQERERLQQERIIHLTDEAGVDLYVPIDLNGEITASFEINYSVPTPFEEVLFCEEFSRLTIDYLKIKGHENKKHSRKKMGKRVVDKYSYKISINGESDLLSVVKDFEFVNGTQFMVEAREYSKAIAKTWGSVDPLDSIKYQDKRNCGDYPSQGTIQPEWGAKRLGFTIEIGPIQERGYRYGPDYLGTTEMCAPSMERFEDMAKESGLKIERCGEYDMDGMIEDRYRFVQLKKCC